MKTQTALIKLDKISEKERKISLTLDGAVRLRELTEELPEGDSNAILYELFKDTGVEYRGGSIYNTTRVNWKGINAEYNFYDLVGEPEAIIEAWLEDAATEVRCIAKADNEEVYNEIKHHLVVEQWLTYSREMVSDASININKRYDFVSKHLKMIQDSIKDMTGSEYLHREDYINPMSKVEKALKSESLEHKLKLEALVLISGDDLINSPLNVSEAYREYRSVEEPEKMNVDFTEEEDQETVGG